MNTTALLDKIHAAAEKKKEAEKIERENFIDHLKLNVDMIHTRWDEMKSLVKLFNEMAKCGLDAYGPEHPVIGFARFSNRTDIILRDANPDKFCISVLDDGNVLDVMYNGYDALSMLADPEVPSERLKSFATLLYRFAVHYTTFRDNYIKYIESL